MWGWQPGRRAEGMTEWDTEWRRGSERGDIFAWRRRIKNNNNNLSKPHLGLVSIGEKLSRAHNRRRRRRRISRLHCNRLLDDDGSSL